MRAADFDRARAIVDKRASAMRLRNRLAANERIALAVGSGSDLAEIELASAFQVDLRRDFIAALDHEIRLHEDALRMLGVEP